MSHLTLKVDVVAGTTISAAMIESEQLARIVCIPIEFTFNGVDIKVWAGGDIDKGVYDYEEQMKKEPKYRMVFVR